MKNKNPMLTLCKLCYYCKRLHKKWSKNLTDQIKVYWGESNEFKFRSVTKTIHSVDNEELKDKANVNESNLHRVTTSKVELRKAPKHMCAATLTEQETPACNKKQLTQPSLGPSLRMVRDDLITHFISQNERLKINGRCCVRIGYCAKINILSCDEMLADV